jgi:hypothetical protein
MRGRMIARKKNTKRIKPFKARPKIEKSFLQFFSFTAVIPRIKPIIFASIPKNINKGRTRETGDGPFVNFGSTVVAIIVIRKIRKYRTTESTKIMKEALPRDEC